MPPFPPTVLDDLVRPPAPLSYPSAKLFSRSGVSRTSPSPSSMSSNVPRRFGVWSSYLRLLNWAAFGGEGVDNKADEAAVELEGLRKFLAGVEKPDTSEPRERSG